MIAIPVSVVWLGYTMGIWGYCLVRGYNVKFTDVFKTTWPGAPAAKKKKPAPPPGGGGTPEPA